MIWLLNLITFLSAFLLFQIELIIAKVFLPNYGGSYLVWGACVVFFQAALLLGYLFAQHFIDRWGMERYRKLHVALVLLPFLVFPGRGLIVNYSENQLPLVVDVFWGLLATVGPVFFVLSTMSVTWQVWLSRSALPQRHNPYALYAVSNLGSFAALISYPFVFEYFLGLSQQTNIWRVAYVVFAALNVLAFVLVKVKDEVKSEEGAAPVITRGEVLRWMLLGAGGVVMFLSVTNMITYEVTPVPLFWILPLSIYLLAFVLNFQKNPWCPSWISNRISLIIGLSVSLFFIIQQSIFPPVISIVILCVLLFLLCMYCQRQLMVHKPKSDRSLAFFYVVISFGSFLGGFLTSWIIPLVSTNTVEYLVGLLLIGAVRIFDKKTARPAPLAFVAFIGWGFILTFWAKVFPQYSLVSMAVLGISIWAIAVQMDRSRFIFVAALGLIVLVSTPLESQYRPHGFIHKERNYYGIYEIIDGTQMRSFIHGTTLHGVQLHDGPLKPVPVGYYSPTSAVGELMIENQNTFKNVALIGLGAGSLAGYGNPAQNYDFYELDPDVYRLAKEYFTYIDVSASNNRFIFGDARLMLEKNADRQYDAIIVDAFGGDSIPVHLVTKDVVEKYRARLTPGASMIVFHATNRYIGLEPILARIAHELGAYVCYKDVPTGGVNLRSLWVVMTWDAKQYQHLTAEKGWLTFDPETVKRYPLWTDQYSSILPILKVDSLTGALKAFKYFKI